MSRLSLGTLLIVIAFALLGANSLITSQAEDSVEFNHHGYCYAIILSASTVDYDSDKYHLAAMKMRKANATESDLNEFKIGSEEWSASVLRGIEDVTRILRKSGSIDARNAAVMAFADEHCSKFLVK